MAMIEIDEPGPVDCLVVEFPPRVSHFTAEMATEVARRGSTSSPSTEL